MAGLTFTSNTILYAQNLNDAFSTGIANNDWTFTNTISFSNSIVINTSNTYIQFPDTSKQYTAAISSYDLGFNFEDIPITNEVLGRFVFPRAASIIAGAPGSIARAGVNATANTDLRIQKNGTTFGTLRFQAANPNGIFTSVSAQTFVAGDVLTIVANTVQDITLSRIGITISNFTV